MRRFLVCLLAATTATMATTASAGPAGDAEPAGRGEAVSPSLAAFPDSAPPPFYPDKMNLLVWLDGQGRSHPVENARDWERRREHILANMQLVMGGMPPREGRVPLDVEVLETEDLPRLVRKKITYAATADYRVPAYLLIPRDRPRRLPAVLCLHGTGGPRGRTAGLGDDYPRYTLELAERGYVTIAPDYTLLGDNQVDPRAVGFASGTMMGIWSHLRAVDLLESLEEVDRERIGCCGVSLGGHNTLFVGAFDPRIKALVCSSGFDSFADYMGGNLTGWCQPRYMPRIAAVFEKDPAKMPFDFPEVLAALAPRPLFVHAPLEDHNFRVESVKRCVAAAGAVYRLWGAEERLTAVYPPGGHGFPPEIREAAYRFLDNALKSEEREEKEVSRSRRAARATRRRGSPTSRRPSRPGSRSSRGGWEPAGCESARPRWPPGREA
jgi:dienelactone hydrolase